MFVVNQDTNHEFLSNSEDGRARWLPSLEKTLGAAPTRLYGRFGCKMGTGLSERKRIRILFFAESRFSRTLRLSGQAKPRRKSDLEKALPNCKQSQFEAIRRSRLVEDVGDVMFDCLFTDGKLLRYR